MEIELKKEDVVLFVRNKTLRVGKVTNKGPVNLGLSVVDMKSKTRISSNQELVPLTIYVTKEAKERILN